MPKVSLIVVEPLKYVLALTVMSSHPVKSAVMVRSLSITTLILALPDTFASISPDHFTNWHPLEGTAVKLTTVPGVYVLAAHSGGFSVTLPPHSGTLTTVS